MAGRRQLLALAAALGAGMVAPPAHAGWSAPVDLSGPDVVRSSAVAAAGADGTAVVAWSRVGVVEAAVKPAGAAFGAPVRLGAGSGPGVAVDDEGSVLVGWRSAEGLRLAERSPGGRLAGPGTVVAAPVDRFALAFTATGRALVAHAGEGTRALETRARDAAAFTPAWSVTGAPSTGSIDVGAGPGGDEAWTAWADSAGAPATHRVVARRWTAASGAEPERTVATLTDVPSPDRGTSSYYGFGDIRVVGGDHASVVWRAGASESVDYVATGSQTLGAVTATEGLLGEVQTLASISQTGLGSGALAGPPAAVVLGDGGALSGASLTEVTSPELARTSGISLAQRTGAGFGPAAPWAGPGFDVLDATALATLPGDRALVVHRAAEATVIARVRGAAGGAEGPPVAVGADEPGVVPTDVVAAGDGRGGALVAWVRTEDGVSRLVVTSYDEAAPAVAIAGPDSVAVGRPATFGASGDRWGPSSAAWSTGDGGSETGAAISHAWTAPGRYTIDVRVTDAAGNVGSTTRSVTVTAPPSSPPLRPAADRTTPTLSGVSLTRTRWAVARSRARPSTSTLRLTLSEPASVTLAVRASTRGYRSRGSCVATRPRPRRRARRCTLLRTVASQSLAGAAGANRVPLTARFGRRRLAPGAYRLVLAARDAAGNRSSSVTVHFTLVRP